jgi:hypothetical protein
MGSFKPPRGAFQPDEFEHLQNVLDAALITLRALDPARNVDDDHELRTAISEKICALAATGVTDPEQLRDRVVASLSSSI